MELMDKMHVEHPEYGLKRMFEWLKNETGGTKVIITPTTN